MAALVDLSGSHPTHAINHPTTPLVLRALPLADMAKEHSQIMQAQSQLQQTSSLLMIEPRMKVFGLGTGMTLTTVGGIKLTKCKDTFHLW